MYSILSALKYHHNHLPTFLGFRNVICCRWRIKNVSSPAISLDFIKGSASHGSLFLSARGERVKKKTKQRTEQNNVYFFKKLRRVR